MVRELVLGLGAVLVAAGTDAAAQSTWYRGNVHVHTTESDGHSSPEQVVEWYRSHGYQFFFITDHDLQTVTDELAARFEAPGRFLVLPGVEVTDRVGTRPVHLNGLGVTRTVQPQGGADVPDAIHRNASAIERAGGLPVLNHPNGVLRVALQPAEMMLVWIGTILGPADRAAMDGLALLLFTVVPIRLFSWTAAAVFTALGLRILRRTLRAEPTLSISETGVTLPNGTVIQWVHVRSATSARNDLLRLELAPERTHTSPPRARPGWLRWPGLGTDKNQVILSSFELGADPAAVVAELESRRAEAERRVS